MMDEKPRSSEPEEGPPAEGGSADGAERAADGHEQACVPSELERRKLEAILDSLAGLVYVSDPETYDVLYANRALAGGTLTAVGEKCYRAFGGRSSPCATCPNERLLGRNPVACAVREHWDEQDGRWYRCVDKAIPWPDGRRVRCGMALDITEHKKVEEALRRSEEEYRRVLENANEAIVVAQDGMLKYMNPRVAELSCYSEDALARTPFSELIHPDDREEVLARHLKRQRGEDVPPTSSFRVVNARGETRHVECTAVALSWEGRPASLIFLTDVTERMRAEETLRQNEERYRAVSELTSDFAYVLAINPDGTLFPEWVSGTFERITGYPMGEVETPGVWHTLVLDEDRVIWERQFQSSLKGGCGSVEYRIRTRSGEVRWLRDHARAIWDTGHTRVTHVYGAIQDITGQREAEEIQSVLFQISQAVSASSNLGELLATIHRELGTLLDTTNFYVALYDEKTDTYSFPYHVDQCDKIEELTDVQLKKSLTDYVRRTGEPLLVDEVTNERLVEEGEIELVGAPSPIWLGVPLRISTRVIGVVVVQSYVEGSIYSMRDLEIMSFVSDNIAIAIERKRADEERGRLQAQIQHAQKLESLGVLAGGIAHDFNNLLTGILGNADLGLMAVGGGSPVQACLKSIKTTAERAADLSRQMLAYSGKGSFVIGPIDLNEVVREMGHLLEVSVSKKALLRYQLSSDVPRIVADATQIRQVIMNLITNASDAIGESDGVIAISTGIVRCTQADLATSYLDDQLPRGPYVFLTVEDTGCGMDGGTVQRIFDPFFTTKFTGRGLGLAAALGIVRGHKGAIQVESEVGRGTRFRILLPVAGDVARVGEKPRTEATEWRPSGTVLLVDDEPAVREIGARLLEQAGLTVVTAADGLQAVQFLKEHPHDVSCVLLDLSMPHMGGEETFRELRRIRENIPVILSSGYSEQEVVDRFTGQGIAGFVQKPYLVAQLVAEVGAAMKEGADGGREPAGAA